MKAVRFYSAGKPLAVEEIEKPKASATDVIVKTKAAGICHTDLHFLDGTLTPWKGTLPITLGHEIAGEVDSVGMRVKNIHKGDRVVVNNGIACGKCRYCKMGRENLCENLDQIGFTVDGGYAEYVKVPYKSIVKLPKEISYEHGALLPCGVATCYHALFDRAHLRKGETVLINGIGGLGSSAIQLAKNAGAKVVAVDVIDEKLEMAKKLGADLTVNAKTEDLASKVKTFTGSRGVDVALELVGRSATLQNALSNLGKTARYAIVGYTKDKLEITPLNLVVMENEIHGVVAYTKNDLKAVVRLTQTGKIRPVIAQRVKLEGVHAALESLKDGSVQGRSVAIP